MLSFSLSFLFIVEIRFVCLSDLFKSKTLEYFSKTLPILKADDTLPKVAKYEDNHIAYNPTIFNSQPGSRISFYHHRTRRETEDLEAAETATSFESTDHVETPRQSRGWCDDSYGVFCMLFNAFKGKDNDKVKALSHQIWGNAIDLDFFS